MSAEQKYTQEAGHVYLSGNQVLVRLVVEQARRDQMRGLDTAGLVTGYRGSPLGQLDQDLWSADSLLKVRKVRFLPAINEDMAATTLMGTQQINFFDAKVDGVFGLWYAKGPGVERSGDALRHANQWGTAPHGGVIMAVGDDPMGRSSSIQQQSELSLISHCIPVFNAATVQDLYDFGLIGWQLSRYAGVWVGIKAVSDTLEASADILVDQHRTQTVIPDDHDLPASGLHVRWPDRVIDQDRRMLTERLPAVRAFVRANMLNRITHDVPNRRLGIISSGKSYIDVLEALSDLGIDLGQRTAIGLAIYKVALVWPLEESGVLDFAGGCDEILVIEEGRAILEPQVKDILYQLPDAHRPRICGKRGHDGNEALNSFGEITPAMIARVLAKWLGPMHKSATMQSWLDLLERTDAKLAQVPCSVMRTPYFCSGCPHSTSTRVPEGSRQLLGIGCHWLANFMQRDAISYTQMGGEGASWVGTFPFVNDQHIFVNIGDGTYYHSGSLAIRQAVAAGINITYKILYNDAVAMTGGQPVDGPISVAQITHEMHGTGVKNIGVISNEPAKFRSHEFAPGTAFYPREELDSVQRQLRQQPGVSVIVYEQTCAAELRRRRTQGLVPAPGRRVFINDRVCDGCGDCGVKSNCLSVLPLDTEFGRKRIIDQSACNMDFTCLNGNCPAFVTVEGGMLRKGKELEIDDARFMHIPEPEVACCDEPFGVLIAGIGGTGVVTLSNLIAAAAKLDGRFAQALDLTGMAQKFGSVYCHLRVAACREDILASRLSIGKARVLIGADLVTSAHGEALSRLHEGTSVAIVNDHGTMTGAFTRDVNFRIPIAEMKAEISRFTGLDRAKFHDTIELARHLTGDSIGANMLLLGFASQCGWLPVRHTSLEQAIEANNIAVTYNLTAFKLGRLLAYDPTSVYALMHTFATPRASHVRSTSLDETIARREQDLVTYHDAAYSARYRNLMDAVRAAEEACMPGEQALTLAVAHNLYRVMAIKDEYEVARLFADPEFEAAIGEQFDGNYQLHYHFAPPLLSLFSPANARQKKRKFGPRTVALLRWLAGNRHGRASWRDPFARTDERRRERQFRDDYEATLYEFLEALTPDNYAHAVAFARLPEEVRGFGSVKSAALERMRSSWEQLIADFRQTGN